jgi:hypothetical protein
MNSQHSRNKGFSYYFCLMIEGPGSVPQTNGSGSGSDIRIRNTAWTKFLITFLLRSRPETVDSYNDADVDDYSTQVRKQLREFQDWATTNSVRSFPSGCASRNTPFN